MFYFRSDTNETIATGHIMRCISIANELKKRNIASTFITADHAADTLIHSKGHHTFCLNSTWNNMETEINTIIKYIISKQIDKLLIDSYYITDTYLDQLSRHTKVIYLDDLGIIKYPVNTIINYSNYAESLGYQERFAETSVNLILGGQYVPLREEFQLAEPSFRKTLKTVLISTGGGDIYNVAGSLLELILSNQIYDQFHFIVISGKFNTNYEKLKRQSEQTNNVTILQNVQEMSKLMLSADLAITAGGSTMYELCACGVPMLIFTFADNQLYGANDFAKRKAAFYAGDVREGQEQVALRLLEKILALSNHWKERERLIKNASSVINKHGVVNLVDKLIEI